MIKIRCRQTHASLVFLTSPKGVTVKIDSYSLVVDSSQFKLIVPIMLFLVHLLSVVTLCYDLLL